MQPLLVIIRKTEAGNLVANLLQFDTSTLLSMFVLIAMSCISLVFFLFLRSKSRAIRKLPKSPSISVFTRTFNVFDPYPDRRKTIHSHIALFLTLTFIGSLIFTVSIVAIWAMGFILSLTIIMISLSLIIIEETFETQRNADLITKAIRNDTPLGKGDLTVFHLVKETLPKLKTYYLLLSIVFLASSITLPYIIQAVVPILSGFIGALVEVTKPAGFLAPYSAVFLFITIVIITQAAVGRIKSRILGFPASGSLIPLGEQFERMKVYVAWHMHELLHRPVPEPEETPDSERETA